MRRKVWIAALLCLTVLTACVEEKIPSRSKSFIDEYFPKLSVVLVEIEDDGDGQEYDVLLNDGTKIEFDMQGEWKRIGRNKTGIPSILVPPAITQYVKTYYPKDVITKLSRKPYGYKIEISNDMDLRFNAQGQFIEEID